MAIFKTKKSAPADKFEQGVSTGDSVADQFVRAASTLDRSNDLLAEVVQEDREVIKAKTARVQTAQDKIARNQRIREGLSALIGA